MRKRLFIVFTVMTLVSSFPFMVSAQISTVGQRVTENYETMNTPGSEQNWCIAKDTRGIMYFGNQQDGVISFDGQNWSRIMIDNDSRIYSLKADDKGRVYVGAAYEFGYLTPDETGLMKYRSLVSMIDSASVQQVGAVYSILIDSNRVLFSTRQKFFVYYPESDRLEELDFPEEIRNVTLTWNVSDRIIIADNGSGLFELRGDEVIRLEGGEYFSNSRVRSMLPGREDGELFIGTWDSGVFLYNCISGEVNDSFLDDKVNDLLKEYRTYEGTVLSDDLIAFSTPSYGVFIFNKDGELIEQINADNSELQDNAIFSMFFDNNGGFPILWLSNYGYISKVYMGLPYKVVNIEEWDNSAMNSLCVYKGDLYISNDNGVLQSYWSGNDIEFRKIEGVGNQTFPLMNFSNGSSNLLLIGTIDGLFSYNGSDLKEIKNSDKGNYIISLNQSEKSPEYLYVGLVHAGVQILEFENGEFVFREKIKYLDDSSKVSVNGSVSSIVEDKHGDVWFSTDDPNSLYHIKYEDGDTLRLKADNEYGLSGRIVTSVAMIGDKLVLATEKGLMYFDDSEQLFKKEDTYISDDLLPDMKISSVFEDNDGDLWFGASLPRNLIYYYPADLKKDGIISRPFYTMPNTSNSDIEEYKDRIWVANSKQLFVIDKKQLTNDYGRFESLIRKVVINSDSVIFNGSFFTVSGDGLVVPSLYQTRINTPEMKYAYNDISFFFSSPYYLKEDSIRFSYKLEGFDRDWSKWTYVNYRDYTNLPNGNYKFKVRSKNIMGIEAGIADYEFVILRPWYLSIGAILSYVVLAFLLVYAIIKIYTRRLINENIRLEGIVEERTREVVMQKEELESSIHYASRIQRAILPAEDSLKSRLDDYFILFMPRDIVSGDYYWVSERGSRLYIVAADCTGHGVPGAFMSLLGVSFLDEIVNKSKLSKTNKILDQLRLHVTESLKQMGEDEDETKDGMDLGILAIDFETEEIEYSGAYNPCWMVRELSTDEKKDYNNGELVLNRGDLSDGENILMTIEADRMPIGISSHMNKPFSVHKHKMEEGVTYYMSSDGYCDQFGGEHGRKFLKKNMKKLILELQGVPVNQQRAILEQKLAIWMGDIEQIDDILVMGIRVK